MKIISYRKTQAFVTYTLQFTSHERHLHAPGSDTTSRGHRCLPCSPKRIYTPCYLSGKRGQNVPLFFFSFFNHHFLLSSSTREIFHPQRPPGQAVVTSLFPSPPRYVLSLRSRIGFKHSHFSDFYARRLLLIDNHRILHEYDT